MRLDEVTNKTIDVVKNVGEFIREERKKLTVANIEVKGKHDFVTHVDKGAEELLVQSLGQIVPGSGYIAEEGTSNKKGEIYNWIIDPLDGTTNFIHGAPPYAISVALMEKDDVVLGVVYEITLDECFYSHKGSPVFLNGVQVNTSNVKSVSGSLIATGFPYHDYGRLAPFMDTLDFLFHNSHGVRRLGSAATDLAYVACGRYDAFYEYNLKPWDVAAGAFLVVQAGGGASDFKGGNNYVFGKELVASNSFIFNEFQTVIGRIMNV